MTLPLWTASCTRSPAQNNVCVCLAYVSVSAFSVCRCFSGFCVQLSVLWFMVLMLLCGVVFVLVCLSDCCMLYVLMCFCVPLLCDFSGFMVLCVYVSPFRCYVFRCVLVCSVCPFPCLCYGFCCHVFLSSGTHVFIPV